MDKKALLLAGLVTAGFVILIWLSQTQNRTARLQTVTVYSRSNKSLSLFREWKNAAAGQSAVVNHKALLFIDELAEFDGIMIASPRLRISAKEATILAEYMMQGGRLMLSAHDRGTYANLGALLEQIRFKETIRDTPNFTNREIMPAATNERTTLFAPSQRYGFYSLIQFDGPHCRSQALSCFAREIPFGQGHMIITLGLPLPGNAMISHLNNLEFTLAFGQWTPRLLIDEYHHFFTQKTWGDLISRVDFALPLGGMLAGLILLFLFGHSSFYTRLPLLPPSRAHHDLNENIVNKFLQDPAMANEAVEKQHQFLLRLFPEHADRVNDLHRQASQRVSRRSRNLSQALQEAAQFHREQLKNRGRKGKG